jgi:hypothetical protein
LTRVKEITNAPVIRENPKAKGNVETANRKEGDVEAGFKSADQIMEFEWNLPYFTLITQTLPEVRMVV